MGDQRPIPGFDQAGDPRRHGYVRCARCGTWRPDEATVLLVVEGEVCVDRAWCSRQAGVGKGELTGGAP